MVEKLRKGVQAQRARLQRLAAVAEAPASTFQPAAKSQASDKGHIVVAEDNADYRAYLTRVLEGAGFEVDAHMDGAAALAACRIRAPDALVSDVAMPDLDGLGLIACLRADEHTALTPVLLLSGRTAEDDRIAGIEAGADDYLVKPLSGRELIARVEGAVRRSRLRREAAHASLQSQLRENRDQFEGIYQSVGDGVISINAEQRIVESNAAAARIFGYSAAAMIGLPLAMLLPARFRPRHEDHIGRFGASGQSNRTMGTYGLIYGLRASGEEFPLEATVSQSDFPRKQLFTVILRDITERRQTEELREQLQRQLELLSERLTTAQEMERHSIARELHEELGQDLMTLKLHLQMIGSAAGGTQADTHQKEALTVVKQATERIRRLVLDLEPPELGDFGVQAAARIYCERQALAGGWELRIDAPKPEVRAPLEMERACFRILQEGLNNILQHAKAKVVRVQVQCVAGELLLRLRDDGIGFDRIALGGEHKREGGRLGLFAMQIRARQAGGVVEVDSSAGAGTEVRARFPLSVKPVAPV